MTEIIIHTGFQGHQDGKVLEIKANGKSVKIPFQSLDKFPMNNSFVSRVGVKTEMTPGELQILLDNIK